MNVGKRAAERGKPPTSVGTVSPESERETVSLSAPATDDVDDDDDASIRGDEGADAEEDDEKEKWEPCLFVAAAAAACAPLPLLVDDEEGAFGLRFKGMSAGGGVDSAESRTTSLCRRSASLGVRNTRNASSMSALSSFTAVLRRPRGNTSVVISSRLKGGIAGAGIVCALNAGESAGTAAEDEEVKTGDTMGDVPDTQGDVIVGEGNGVADDAEALSIEDPGRMRKQDAGNEASGITTEPMKSADIKSSSYTDTWQDASACMCVKCCTHKEKKNDKMKRKNWNPLGFAQG